MTHSDAVGDEDFDGGRRLGGGETSGAAVERSDASGGGRAFSGVVFDRLDGQSGLPRWFSLVFAVVRRMEIGSLSFQMPDGRIFRASGDRPGPDGLLIVRDPRFFGRIIRHGNLGFCEAYLDDWWRSPDLQAVLDALLLNNEIILHSLPGGRVAQALNKARHWLNRNTKRRAKRNIEAHYDLGNAFYEQWLDPSMTYSSALFHGADQSLEAAQRAKYKSICDRMNLQPGDHVLEIGCGWGGFAEYAAGERGARVTGLTLSPSQLDYARARLQKSGLNDRVELVLRDYRDERGAYDGVASIEMFEAVGEAYWPSYFEAVRDRLKPGGRASLQIITISDRLFDRYRTSVDFVQKYVFPGGMLPSLSALKRETDRAGLAWIDRVDFGEDYSRTLRLWAQRFNATWEEIQDLPGARPFDARFHRLWNLYLASCAACFEAGTTDVTQIALKRA